MEFEMLLAVVILSLCTSFDSLVMANFVRYVLKYLFISVMHCRENAAYLLLEKIRINRLHSQMD